MDTKKSIEESIPENYEAAEQAFAEMAEAEQKEALPSKEERSGFAKADEAFSFIQQRITQEPKKEALSFDERYRRWFLKLQSGQANW